MCRYGLKHAYILQDLIAWNPAIWDRYHLNSEEQAFVKRDIDFSQIPFSAVFVIHDNGMDWGLATQVITEVLASNGGVLGTRRDVSSGVQVPLILTNPDVIWGSWVLIHSTRSQAEITLCHDSEWGLSVWDLRLYTR